MCSQILCVIIQNSQVQNTLVFEEFCNWMSLVRSNLFAILEIVRLNEIIYPVQFISWYQLCE